MFLKSFPNNIQYIFNSRKQFPEICRIKKKTYENNINLREKHPYHINDVLKHFSLKKIIEYMNFGFLLLTDTFIQNNQINISNYDYLFIRITDFDLYEQITKFNIFYLIINIYHYHKNPLSKYTKFDYNIHTVSFFDESPRSLLSFDFIHILFLSASRDIYYLNIPECRKAILICNRITELNTTNKLKKYYHSYSTHRKIPKINFHKTLDWYEIGIKYFLNQKNYL